MTQYKYSQIFIFLVLGILFIFTSCSTSNTSSSQTSQVPVLLADEEKAIKETIKMETEHFFNGNIEKWSASFVQEPHLFWTVTPSDDMGAVMTLKGYDNIVTLLDKSWFSTYSEDLKREINNSKIIRKDWMIQVRKNVAWASYTQHNINQLDGKEEFSTETRVLEKIKGQWKLAMQSTLVDFKKGITKG